jgi:alkanesulfonate monooxygenase SsuD/methylene tetrahydromethanopterin reductase-like flavin-dependent oxidoreductase (luciferase family)
MQVHCAAEEAAMLDNLTGGRFDMGLGLRPVFFPC